jgi:hypothetical protein
VPLPAIGKLPSVTLPLGFELQAVADLSKGPPTDCQLIHSLFVQLMPFLGSLTCILKILGVIGSLEDFMTSFSKGPSSAVSSAGEVLKSIADMKDCISLAIPAMSILETIKGILLLVISYLECFVAAIKSILDIQSKIKFTAAQGNPALLSSMQCASDNSQTAMQQLMQALQVVEALFKIMQPLLKLSPIQIQLPSLGQIPGAKTLAEIKQSVDQLDAMLLQLKQLVESLP